MPFINERDLKCQLKSLENHKGKVKKTEKFEDKAKKP